MQTHYSVEMRNNYPALSLDAWERMLIGLRGYDTEPLPGTPFRIAHLPQWEKVRHQPDDQWVMEYERFQSNLARQARKNGKMQDGVFYTPAVIATYLAQRTLGRLLEERFQAIERAMRAGQTEEASVILQGVRQLKMIDPACGTGVFLVEMLRLLSEFYRRIQQRFSTLSAHGSSVYVFQNQLYGIDLDRVSVAITEFRLAQWTCRFDQTNWRDFDSYQSGHYVCGDTLNDSPFPALQWDFVLGNPPYVSEVRRQSGRLKPLQERGSFYQAKMDLCDAFTAWGIQRLKMGGQLAYVLPEYWMQRSSSALLRESLWGLGVFREIWTFGQTVVFKNAPGHHTSLLVWEKHGRPEAVVEASQSVAWGRPQALTQLSEAYLIPSLLMQDQCSGKLLLGSKVEMALLGRFSERAPLLSSEQIQQGIVLPQGRLKKSDWQNLPEKMQALYQPDAGIFLLTEKEVVSLALNEKEWALFKPYYGPAGFLPFQGFGQQEPVYQLIYTDRTVRQLLESDTVHYTSLKAHLERFAPVLTSAFKPYGLHRPRQKKWFENERKILCPRQVLQPSFAVVPHPAYVTEGFYSILAHENEDALCAILNSQWAWFWFYHQKRKGHRLQIDKEVLLSFPRPVRWDAEITDRLALFSRSLAEAAISPEEQGILSAELNRLVDQIYEITSAEQNCIRVAHEAIFAAR